MNKIKSALSVVVIITVICALVFQLTIHAEEDSSPIQSDFILSIEKIVSYKVLDGKLVDPLGHEFPYNTLQSVDIYSIDWSVNDIITYAILNGSVREIWLVNNDGSNYRKLTLNGGAISKPTNIWDPRFSPDGTKILFLGDPSPRLGLAQGDVYITNIDGSALDRITDTRTIISADWINNTSIIYSQNEAMNGSSLYLLNLETNRSVQITEAKNPLHVEVSPSGKKILYLNHDGLQKVYFVLDLATSEEKTVNQFPAFFHWGSDDNHLLYATEVGYGVYASKFGVIKLTELGREPLYGTVLGNFGSINGTYTDPPDVSLMSVSPDGNSVAVAKSVHPTFVKDRGEPGIYVIRLGITVPEFPAGIIIASIAIGIMLSLMRLRKLA